MRQNAILLFVYLAFLVGMLRIAYETSPERMLRLDRVLLWRTERMYRKAIRFFKLDIV